MQPRGSRLGVRNWCWPCLQPTLQVGKSLSSLSLSFPICELGWVGESIFHTTQDCRA